VSLPQVSAMAPQRMISARDAQRLLDSIRGLSFVDPRYHSAIFNVLDQLALWDPAQHHHGVADAWIRRLYQASPILQLEIFTRS
jgi:hypothetical protein